MINEADASTFLSKLFDGRIVLTVAAIGAGCFVLGAVLF